MTRVLEHVTVWPAAGKATLLQRYLTAFSVDERWAEGYFSPVIPSQHALTDCEHYPPRYQIEIGARQLMQGGGFLTLSAAWASLGQTKQQVCGSVLVMRPGQNGQSSVSCSGDAI